MKKLIIEFLGTLFFVLTIALTFDPFAIAAMLMAWVYIGHFVSGGHYNPAVSVGVALRGKLSWHTCGYYILSQILGAFVAFGLTNFLHGHVSFPKPGPHISFPQAFVVEILLTFVFVLLILVLNTSERFKGNDIFGLAIGLIILALAAIGAPISGGLFNPAISLGAFLYSLLIGFAIPFQTIALYVGGGFIGAALAAYAFHHFIAEEHEEFILFNFIKK